MYFVNAMSARYPFRVFPQLAPPSGFTIEYSRPVSVFDVK